MPGTLVPGAHGGSSLGKGPPSRGCRKGLDERHLGGRGVVNHGAGWLVPHSELREGEAARCHEPGVSGTWQDAGTGGGPGCDEIPGLGTPLQSSLPGGCDPGVARGLTHLGPGSPPSLWLGLCPCVSSRDAWHVAPHSPCMDGRWVDTCGRQPNLHRRARPSQGSI